MRNQLRCISIFIFWIFLTVGAGAQTFKFKHFAEADGINTRFTYSINQDFNGYLLVGTDEGLYQFDGFRFSVYYTEDGLAENFIRCSFKDSKGNLWFGHELGGVTKYDGNDFIALDLSQYTSSRINALCESDNGDIWVITQTDGLVKINADLSVEQFSEGIEEFMLYSAYVEDLDNIFLGTDMGLVTCKITPQGKCEVEYTDIRETKVNSITLFSDYELIIGTDDSGIYQVKTGNELIFRSLDIPDFQESRWSINDIDMGPQGNIWVSTNTSGLFQLNY
ncbi:MAG: ligand-binding sensor domain-containing protein, partial [Flavobacteriales bacterium]